jgi:hypothetical protein
LERNRCGLSEIWQNVFKDAHRVVDVGAELELNRGNRRGKIGLG